MIRMERTDRIAIELTFDEIGNHKLSALFNELHKIGSCGATEIVFDKSMVRMKKKRIEKTKLKMCRSENEDMKMYMDENTVVWEVGDEEIQYAKEGFELCERMGYYSPAEFARVKVEKNRELDWIYCKLLKEKFYTGDFQEDEKDA